MDTIPGTVLVGIGATATLDAWVLVRGWLFASPLPDYAHVGRWLGHMPSGRFRHDAIADATPVRGEAWLGWISHYLIGIAFAALLTLYAGPGWLRTPTIGPALALGVATVAAPFLLMQPGMGAGFAASRAARPGKARIQSLAGHAVFGLGLYLSALLLTTL